MSRVRTDSGPSPEDIELQRKTDELQALEALLAERELELATLRAELQAFERRYLHAVGLRMRQLDELEAELAELQARRAPEDFILKVKARRARTKADGSAREGDELRDGKEFDAQFIPSNNLKSLYRELAKKVHPDLATTAKEGARRTSTMAEVNAAYAAGDEAKLRQLLAAWRQSPESVEGEGAGAELVRVIRKIARVQMRLAEIKTQLSNEKDSDIHKLWAEDQALKVERGGDLIEEMARHLDGRIDAATEQLVRERAAVRPPTGGFSGA